MIARFAAACVFVVGVAGCTRSAPNVILITVDTLRADHLGAYGYALPVSPSIDAFGREATVFENAVAQAPHTIPSLLQIMTSKYRQSLGIAPQDLTLAEFLRGYGYQTAAVVDNALLELDPTARGLMTGFDRFYRNGILDPDVAQQHWKTKTPADCITAQARRWLKTREPDHPFFLWLHYFDPHDPYLPPFADNLELLSRNSGSQFTGDIRNTFLFTTPEGHAVPPVSANDRNHLIALYDAEIRYLDQSIGELFQQLKDDGLYKGSLIVLSADHGESFGEHGLWMHGHSLYQPEVHVPLIVKSPAQPRGQRIALPVQAIDIFPTIADIAQAPVLGATLDGVSLRQRKEEPVFAFWGAWQLVRNREFKLVQFNKRTQLFRVATDPGELHDLAQAEPAVVNELVAARIGKLAALQTSAAQLKEATSEAVERMRALGYMPE
jgi:arylsulfatase